MADFENAPVVVLSSIDWDAAWQRHQVFASLWAAAGRSVFFVENLGFREPRLEDWRRVAARLKRLAKPETATRNPRPDRVRIVSPALLPPTREWFRKINQAVLVPRLAAKLKALGAGPKPIVICYLPTATTLALLDELQPGAVLYDCVDNFAGHATPPANLTQTERALLARADAVVTTSPTLRRTLEHKHARVVELHQGVPDEFFIDARGRAPAKRLAYFGTVWGALDFKALGALAKAGFEVELIGPVKEDVRELPAGVVSKGPLAHHQLPDALKRYDALLLPYAKTPYNDGVAPAKLYECLATGLPVLSAPLPALRELKELLRFAATPADWVAAARAKDDAKARERRLAAAKEMRQSGVFERLAQEARRAWEDPCQQPRRPAPTRTRLFLEALAPLGLYTLSARVLAFLTLLLAGQWLGPDDLGRAAGAAALGAALAALPALGLQGALVHGLSEEPVEDRQNALISTAVTVFLISAAAWLTALGLLRERLAAELHVSEALFDLGLLLGYASAFALVAESPLVGLSKFARRGAVELVGGIALPVYFAILAAGPRPGYEALTLAWTLAVATSGLSAIATLTPRLRLGFDGASLRATARHWPAAALSLAGGALLVAPQPLLLARADSWIAAGLFSAYAAGTIGLMSALTEPVGMVLGRVADAPLHGAPWRALGWKGALRALLGAPAALVFAALVFWILGDQFPFEWGLGLRFAFAGSAAAALWALAARAEAGGPRGARLASVGRLAAGLANLYLAPRLIAARGLAGAAEALTLAALAGLAWFAALDLVRGRKP